MTVSFFRRSRPSYQPWTTEAALNDRMLETIARRDYGKDVEHLEPEEIPLAFAGFRKVLQTQEAERGHVDEGAQIGWKDLGQIVDDSERRFRLKYQNVIDLTQPVSSPHFHVEHHSGSGRVDVTPDEVRYQGKAADDLQSIYAGMQHARRNQWEAVAVCGESDRDFKLKTWCAAKRNGLEVTNFKPGLTDLLRVREIMKELDHHLNPPATKTSANPNKNGGPVRPANAAQGATPQPIPA